MSANETPGALAGAAGASESINSADNRYSAHDRLADTILQRSSGWLVDEFGAALKRRTPDVMAWADGRWRIPSGAGMPTWGVGRIEPLADGTFQPREHGAPALILPAVEDWALVDLVAVQPAIPGRWWTRRDLAVALGTAIADSVRWHDHSPRHDLGASPLPLLLFPNPLDWLRAAGAGTVILDMRHARPLLSGITAVACSTETLACRLHAALSDPGDVPAILVMEGLRHAA